MGRHVTRNVVWGVLGTLLAAVPAAAQNDERPRPVEILLGVDGIASWVGDGRDVRLSISLPKDERFSFEIFGGAYHDSGAVRETGRDDALPAAGRNIYDTEAIYGVQIRQRSPAGNVLASSPS